MLEAVAFTYTFLVSFVLASAERNRRRRRPHPRHLVLLARFTMALSLTLGVLFGAWALWQRLTG